MEKITSREQLIDFGERQGYKSLVHFCVPEAQCLRHLNDYPRLAVAPHKKFFLDRSQEFADLPDEFFVDAVEVSARIQHVHEPAYTALTNTCITRENFWVFREAVRFATGDYQTLPFIQTMARNAMLKPQYGLHFPHASVDDPTMLAYTPNHEYGKRDRQVRIKVGKYLTKYYADILSAEQIRAFANGMKGLEVKFAEDYEDFRYIYNNGPSSCMAGDFDNIDGNYHPVDVYDTGDFKLAYIELSEDKIVARAFVHEPSKRWVRAYGDEATALGEYLEENGYTKSSSWEGARLRIIRDDSDNYVLPYIDGDARGVKYRSDGMWEIVSSGCEYWCDFTTGVAEDEDMNTCDCCGDRISEDDTHWSGYHQRTIGSCCIDNYNYAYTNRGRDYVHNDDTIYCESDDEHYEYHYAVDYCDIVQVESGDWYKLDDCVQTYDDAWIPADDAVPVGYEGGNEDNTPVYTSEYDYNRDIVIQYDGAEPIAVWHPDYMTPDIHELYKTDTTITTDNGTEIGLRFRTMDEMLLALGVEYMSHQCSKVGFRLSGYHLEYQLKSLNEIKQAA